MKGDRGSMGSHKHFFKGKPHISPKGKMQRIRDAINEDDDIKRKQKAKNRLQGFTESVAKLFHRK